MLKVLFNNEAYFVHHDPLPVNEWFGDEGAANHNRLTPFFGAENYLELFIYGKSYTDQYSIAPKKYPARQSLQASESIARLHQVKSEKTLFWQQNPDVIDAGVFHNDVI